MSPVPKQTLPPPTPRHHSDPTHPPRPPHSWWCRPEMKLHTQMPLRAPPDFSTELLARIKIDRNSAEDPASSWTLSQWGGAGADPGSAFSPQPSCMNTRRHVSLGCLGSGRSDILLPPASLWARRFSLASANSRPKARRGGASGDEWLPAARLRSRCEMTSGCVD